MEEDKEEKETQISELKNNTKTLNEKEETMHRSLDRLEQYSKRNCLLIHAVKENKKKNTDKVIIEILEKEMQENVSSSR